MVLTGAQIVVECLKEQGVDTVFGYPGGTILNVYDALYQHSEEIKHILTSHEQGAAHAADGYARATGRVGVCLATSGPGATNLVTGIATAYMDSVPVVAITCNVNLPLLGKDSFQEVDIAGITMPITKHNYIVKDVNILADTLRKAFAIARSGRPGPVLVDITKDVTANSCEYEKKTPEKAEKLEFAPLIGESPVNIECRVCEVKELGSHHMFLAEVCAVHVDSEYMTETGKFELNRSGLIAYSHGTYLNLGKELGTFGYSVKKK